VTALEEARRQWRRVTHELQANLRKNNTSDVKIWIATNSIERFLE
jgi:hypothetical protein